MGIRGVLAATIAASLLASGCVEPGPEYDDWDAPYLPHGPLEPSSAVAEMQQVTHSAYDEMFQSLSPDASTLLYVSGWFYPDHSIEAPVLIGQSPDSQSSTQFAGGQGFALSPAWMPDGSSYLYATNADGAWQLVRSRSNAPNAAYDVLLSDDAAMPLRPSVAPDGERFAFSTTEAGTRFVAVAGIDGSGVRTLAEGDYPSWSPAGDEILFQAFDAAGQMQLFAISPDGGTREQRTYGPAASLHPSHDPTGDYVVFGSTRDSATHICKVCCGLFVMKTDGSEIIRLVGGDVDADWPSWGSDGWIYFTSNQDGDYDIWRVRMGSEGGGGRVPAQPTEG